VAAWRQQGERIAFVPTMGNLHPGHLSLVERARELAARVVVSIFVNPMQFGPSEDLAAYPRTPEQDRALLEQAGADLLFLPTVAEVYPRPMAEQTRVEVPGLSDLLCGAARPGHFVGVATVVCKLLNMVQPQVALFGEKDFQQLLVIRRMVEDLAMPVEIVGVPTSREADGLARSSRNGYLTPEERTQAPALYATLQWVAAELRGGRGAPGGVRRRRGAAAGGGGVSPRLPGGPPGRRSDPPGPQDRALVILAAAWLGRARLIDNLSLQLP
jgi:pantoate--beta-alanine ligase